MEPIVARKTWRTLEPLHGFVYFAEEGPEEYGAIGIPAGPAAYFASRAAPMGAVPADVVVATFFNFCPDLVHAAIPATWSVVTPEQVLAARRRVAARALRRVLGPAADGPDVAAAAALARTAALAAAEHLEGRPLFAGHAGLDWPDEPLLVLWHAQTLLREYRGDGHVAVLVSEDLSGLEALVLHAATGEIARRALQATRGWSDAEWTAAETGLRARGLLAAAGGLTGTGRARRQAVEDRTDMLAVKAYAALGDDACARLRALVRPLSQALVGSGSFGFR